MMLGVGTPVYIYIYTHVCVFVWLLTPFILYIHVHICMYDLYVCIYTPVCMCIYIYVIHVYGLLITGEELLEDRGDAGEPTRRREGDP